jgi:hypothetical protein
MVAWFCQRGAEALSDNIQNQISDESLIGILEAFLAVYGMRVNFDTPPLNGLRLEPFRFHLEIYGAARTYAKTEFWPVPFVTGAVNAKRR